MVTLPLVFVACTASLGFPGIPWLNHSQHGSVARPLVSLIVLALIVTLVFRAFRNKPD